MRQPSQVRAVSGCQEVADVGFSRTVRTIGPGNRQQPRGWAPLTVAAPAEACLLVSETAVGFGTLAFGQSGDSTPSYTVTCCSDATQDLFASGTDATGTPATWLLDASGSPATDQFSVSAPLLDGTGMVWLDSAAAGLGTLGAGTASPAITHTLVMPPTGSTGDGQTMTFDIAWTAVVAGS